MCTAGHYWHWAVFLFYSEVVAVFLAVVLVVVVVVVVVIVIVIAVSVAVAIVVCVCVCVLPGGIVPGELGAVQLQSRGHVPTIWRTPVGQCQFRVQ